MPEVGKYCKAYLFQQLCQFSNWNDQISYLRKEAEYTDGKEVEVERKLTYEDVVYLQDNYVVTDGIFLDENIIFDNITPEWKAFCQNALQFKVSEVSTNSLSTGDNNE
jgi:hypothetical protein